jgi:hypothetical protein
VAIAVSTIVMIPIVFAATLLKVTADPDPKLLVNVSKLAWPWYVPLGTAVTVLVGILTSLVRRPDGRTAGRPQEPA